ncbi:MAG: hypothetical protein ABW061_20055 [Polyangiaceae bacterium]
MDRTPFGLAGLALLLFSSSLGCTGGHSSAGGKGAPGGDPQAQAGTSAGGGASGVAAGGPSGAGYSGDYSNPGVNPGADPVQTFEPVSVFAAVRKVKNLLTGLPPTDEEIQAVASAQDRPAALRTLINGWTSPDQAATHDAFRGKLIGFFRNAFQQTGFTPNEDFKLQLLENGGFDFGPLGIYADDAFPRLVQNIQDSFALTAWEIVAAGEPFSEVLTTHKFRMTTALKSLYLQIEMPNDQPYSFGTQNKLAWSIDMSGTAIPFADTLDPNSPNHLVFSDEAPLTSVSFQLTPTCQGTAGKVNTYTGYAQLFQRLLGFTPRYKFVAQPECWEHVSLPYFSTQDLSDWTWVTVSKKADGTAYVPPYDLPTLRSATELSLALPRVGFFSTPAYLALWNTNDSNQHRVTANQTLLVAWGASFTSENAIIPSSTAGLDANHAVAGSECYFCHKSLDPLRQFWASQFDFNDRNDFQGTGPGGKSTRPTTTGGALAFGNVNESGQDLSDLGRLLLQGNDSTGLSQFAISFTQKLCFFADSAGCAADDPEFHRVAQAFADSKFDFMTLVRELFSSPLVTGLAATKTFEQRNALVSIARRDQLCASLSNRLGMPDLCALAVAFPFSSGFGASQTSPVEIQRAAFRIAGSLPADAFSRGAESPVTSATPTLFFRAASEMLCENVAGKVVDVDGSRYSSKDPDAAIADMVVTLMGYTAADPHHDPALSVLHDHYTEALAGGTATNALRSVFALACQSPTSLSFGL